MQTYRPMRPSGVSTTGSGEAVRWVGGAVLADLKLNAGGAVGGRRGHRRLLSRRLPAQGLGLDWRIQARRRRRRGPRPRAGAGQALGLRLGWRIRALGSG